MVRIVSQNTTPKCSQQQQGSIAATPNTIDRDNRKRDTKCNFYLVLKEQELTHRAAREIEQYYH